MYRPPLGTAFEIEPLESRIAPAAILTYVEADQDVVKVKVSSGTLEHLVTAATVLNGQLQQLDLSQAAWGEEFAGASVSFTVKKAKTGDGRADVGYLNATGIDLGSITIKGDLGQIDVGDNDPATPAVKALKVVSMGRLGLATQGAAGSLTSDIKGTLFKLTVTGDLAGVWINITGGAEGKLRNLMVQGSLLGGADDNAGLILAEGDIGPVKIKNYLQGGGGENAGRIDAGGDIASVTIGKSVIGGTGNYSGSVHAGKSIGPVKISGNVTGYLGDHSGSIEAEEGTLASATIGGSLTGGSGEERGTYSGHIFSKGQMGPVKIGGNVTGGTQAVSGNIYGFDGITSVTIGGSLQFGGSIPLIPGMSRAYAGEIESTGNIGPVKIGGDLVGGTAQGGTIRASGNIASITIGGSVRSGVGIGGASIFAAGDIGSIKIAGDLFSFILTQSGRIDAGGRIDHITVGGSIYSDTVTAGLVGTVEGNATIAAGNDIGAVKVGGNIVGLRPGDSPLPVVISARGREEPGEEQDLAIGKITVGGRVEFVRILAGHNFSVFRVTEIPVNGDASIGAVKVGGAWLASSLVAGATDGGNGMFGDGDDAMIAGSNSALAATIASITIGGIVAGTPDSTSATDHFGFVAQKIGSFKAGGVAASLTDEKDSPLELASLTGDVTLREL